MIPCRVIFLALAAGLASAAPAADGAAAGSNVAGITRSLHAGDSVEAVLRSLSARGHRVVYSSALVLPEMKLTAAPRATDVAGLLDEVLGPVGLKAVRAANGDWLVVAALPAPRADPPPVTETIETIDVTASRYGLASAGNGRMFLDRQDVQQMPHLADDAVRMLKILPGVSGGDFSAALNIRGGRRDETLLMIDGAEIHNGFHFRDLTGALSVVDTRLVDNIEFTTGGMPAERGDYMSGVVDMRTRRPRADDDYRSVVGVSFVSAYARSGGVFSDDRGSWLVALRRGYLDVVMKRIQSEDQTILPRYTDLFTAVDYDIGERTKLSGRVLLSNDDLRLLEDDDDVDSAGKGESGHAWLTLDHGFGDALQVSTTLSGARIRQTRDSSGQDDDRYGDVDADFKFTFADLRQDWSWTLGERNLLRFGASGGTADADYRYRLEADLQDPRAPNGLEVITRATDLTVHGSKYGVHAAWRNSPVDGLTAELGVRHDTYRYPGAEYSVTAPRVNVVWRLGEAHELRAAWGVIYQPQGIDMLQVEDGVTTYFEPESARNAVLGYSYRFGSGFSARVDVYRKDYSRLHPRFENALDQMQLIPEGAIDRVRVDASEAEASGVELTLRREAERGISGWMSAAFARARDDDGDRWVSRLWEQRRTFSFGASWTGAKWNVSLAGLFHDGAPVTHLGSELVEASDGATVPVIVPGPRNGARMGDYQRIDLRANRDVSVRGGRLSFYLEVTNLLDRKNPCCIERGHVRQQGDQMYLVLQQSNWLPMLPSFGIEYEF